MLRGLLFALFLILIYCSSSSFAQDKQSVNQADIEKLATTLAEAKTDEERISLLAGKKDVITVDLQRTLTKEGYRSLYRGDYPKTLTIFQFAKSIAERIDDKTGIASALNGMGNVYLKQGDYIQALEYYNKSLVLRKEINDKVGIASTINNIAYIYLSQGKYEQALAYFNESLSLSKELNDKPGIARTLGSIGNLQVFQSNYEQALEYFQNALGMHLESKDAVSIANMLNNIGEVQRHIGNYQQALENYHKSLAMSEELAYKPGIAASQNNIGIIYDALGNYRKAIEYYQKSLILSVELNDKDTIRNILNNIGNLFYLQGNYRLAIDYEERSLIMSEELNDPLTKATTLSNLGSIYQSQGNLQKALECQNKSLSLSEELKNRSQISRTLGNLGILSYLQKNYQKALEYNQKGLSIAEELKEKELRIGIMINLSDVYRNQGNFDKALDSANQAAYLAGQIRAQDQLWQAYLKAGVAYYALNKIDQAQQATEKAIHTIEVMRAQAAGEEQSQQLFFENKIIPYQNMVQLLASQNNNTEALSYAERAKARVLLDVLQSGKINISKAMTPQEQDQERIFKNRLVSLNTQLYREKQRDKSDASRISDLEKELDKARLEFEAFQTSLYAAHPELKTQRAEVKPVTLEEASSLLPNPQSALIEFVVAEEKTFLFVITQTPKPAKAGALRRVSQQPDLSSPILKVYTIDVKQKDLAERVRSFREMLAKKELGFRKPGRELYDLLIKPAEEQLKGITTLVIVPEGVLWELPFQALTTPQKKYLLEDCTLYYSPSLTALREMSKPRKQDANDKPTTKTLLAFGNPSLGDESKKPAASVLLGENLEPLPGAEEQVKLLARIYGIKQSKYYIGPEAREQQVKAEAGNYRILQFATHGILNDISPMYSHLVLSQTDDKSDEDGLLEAWEIMQMDLRADLAVLAACETARGRVGAGEGVIGLTWAMFVAGCPTTVVSQWKVEDDATKDLMLEFHRLLKLKYQSAGARSRMTKAEALRQAALKMLKSGREPHPFYWAGFVMTGSGN